MPLRKCSVLSACDDSSARVATRLRSILTMSIGGVRRLFNPAYPVPKSSSAIAFLPGEVRSAFS